MSDKIVSKTWSEDYKNNYNKIFSKEKENSENKYSRIDLVGQNGNNGEHYDCNCLIKEELEKRILELEKRDNQWRLSTAEARQETHKAFVKVKELEKQIYILKSDNTHLRQALQGKKIG